MHFISMSPTSLYAFVLYVFISQMECGKSNDWVISEGGSVALLGDTYIGFFINYMHLMTGVLKVKIMSPLSLPQSPTHLG